MPHSKIVDLKICIDRIDLAEIGLEDLQSKISIITSTTRSHKFLQGQQRQFSLAHTVLDQNEVLLDEAMINVNS
ncbi:uncharacterized protein EAE98_007089 [Botrytis deweyae]|uniref:Uncharacterized protein n=1 Tax=Botrytis deweyae TaxID=2478750 RepID=A0ABQ7II17_9HELO|nr:uncharacterized protein EAE98_007089 [Botrytis deweyae]KAF7925001.1 hypothetical protein EAE98_007089 [Botrytis deweyae]